ncbi:hypothetical protein HMPREF6745_1557 [Prevotella sp. oral taxon 472 str. F0295]|nr:hypothetical protein HMPREF6745_1557 [Prevotella sp. oral taxon 472 str. F0295]
MVIPVLCCIISLFYIKPQPKASLSKNKMRCIISSFYIKPQPTANNDI